MQIQIQPVAVGPLPKVDNREAEEGSEVVDHKADGDLAEEGFVELGVDDVDEEGEEEEDAGDEHAGRVEDVGDVLIRVSVGGGF